MQAVTRALIASRLRAKGRSYTGTTPVTPTPTTPVTYSSPKSTLRMGGYVPATDATIMSGALRASRFLGIGSGLIVSSFGYVKDQDVLGASICGALATMVGGSLPLFYGARIAIIPGLAVATVAAGYLYELEMKRRARMLSEIHEKEYY